MRWLWFLGLALAIGALGLRLIVLRGLDVPRALERRIAVAAGLGASSRCRPASPRSRCARRTRCSCRSGASSTATSRRWRATRFGQAFVVMTLGFAFVLALIFLVVAARPRRAPRPGVRARASCFAGGLSLSGHDARRCRLVVDDRDSRTGCTSPRRRSGSAGSRRWSALVWPGAPRAAAPGVRRLLAARDRARSRSCSAPARTWASCGCRTCTTCGRAATARCCS